MFSALRQGSFVWVLDKGNLTLRVGNVTQTSQPAAFGNMPWMAQMPGQTVDVTVTYDDGTTNEFKQLQPNLAVAVYGNVVVTDTQEAMAKEIDASERQSKSVVESMAFHQRALAAYDAMKKQLSPQYRKEKETEERLSALEGGIKSIKEMLVRMADTSAGVNKC